MEWRVIKLEMHDAYQNMAVDNALVDSVKSGMSAPTMRFYRWKPSAVSIGSFQSMRDEVNVDKCKELGVSCVRRLTGGGAVYHDTEGEITYSVIAPEKLFPKNIIESYKTICGWIIDGLSLVGVHAEFAPINDVVVSGKKVSGNAQTRRDGVLLQHGTVLYKTDVSKMFSLLNVSKEKISDKAIKSVEERVAGVSAYADIGIEQLYESLLKGFLAGKDFEFDTLTEEEASEADRLSIDVYSTDSWNFSR